MIKIITTTQLQQKIGKISKDLKLNAYIVTGRGVAKMVLLPYFDGCSENLDNYMEEYEIAVNKDVLERKIKESIDSGASDLTV